MEDRAAALSRQYTTEELRALRALREDFDPEDRFTDLVREYLSPDDVVVDIGTGTGEWLLAEVYPRVRMALGLDYSARRLWLAAQRKAGLSANAEFLLADARHIPLRDNVASAIINRRGPWTEDEDFMREGLRILAPGGLALEITIGDQNAREFDQAFGARTQMHSWRTRDRLKEMTALYEEHALEVLVAESHLSTEVFPSRDALVYRLQTAPGVEAFDPQTDASPIDRVVADHSVAEGIRLTVHRICLVARITR
ncbi:MAG: class I SAM-dependent methyltransferase [Chloroflexi bacterium]|nr:class I SAM-dependent methyltransferase [Chloroflexota bacterium]